ncbi:MAG TPA: M13 family metallopeptidase, partial [Polyangiaceae bacterium]|nr:M13 family metallopeptidase [Polyangiaceae bacterium]
MRPPIPAFILASGALACSSGPTSPPPAAPAVAPADPARSDGPPAVGGATLESVGLDALAMDPKANPCTDFYRFACGGWLDATEIPADEAMWTRSFQEIDKRNELELKRLLEAAASQAPADPNSRAIGTFYAACMDEGTVNGLGAQPIAPLLAKAARVKDAASVVRLTTELHAANIWPLFDVAPVQDPADASRWIAGLDQGGLGLPDRDYYLREDADSLKLRDFYRGHVEHMLALAGLPATTAKQGAADVLLLETELAKVSKTNVERRDPKGMFNRVSVARLRELAPAFDWAGYFKALSVPAGADVNVTAPHFLEGVQAVLKSQPPVAWRAYLAWQIVRATARTLSQPFVDEAFALEQALTGQAEQKARWRRCVGATDSALPDLLGQAYVATSFAGESKSAAEGMVKAIGAAFARELDTLSWMDGTTRTRAHEKLDAMAYLIGYPSKWKTYDFEIDPKTYAANALRASAFDLARELAKVGKSVDREEWQMSPPTVNAYYDPQRNHMVFPAGILQPPFYSVKSSVAVNLGGIGMVVGHELTHGFDDEGAQFDGDGNLASWWPDAISGRFRERTACMARFYSEYEVLPGLPLNGDLTNGENIADVGGIKLAFRAYRALRNGADKVVVADGKNEDQQFFLGFAQSWCAK